MAILNSILLYAGSTSLYAGSTSLYAGSTSLYSILHYSAMALITLLDSTLLYHDSTLL